MTDLISRSEAYLETVPRSLEAELPPRFAQMDFAQLLDDSRALAAFRTFLLGEYCEENLDFYLAVDALKGLTGPELEAKVPSFSFSPPPPWSSK